MQKAFVRESYGSVVLDTNVQLLSPEDNRIFNFTDEFLSEYARIHNEWLGIQQILAYVINGNNDEFINVLEEE